MTVAMTADDNFCTPATAGDRSFAGLSENEMAVGMPANLIFYTLENLFKSGGIMNTGCPANIPMPMDLDENLTPVFKFMREKIDEKQGKL
jgi:hypothetical protein